jgi:prolyl-tRNA synthetase
MRLSRFFLPVLRETPKEAEIVSHQRMLRSGMVRQASAGIYSWLPLGYRDLKRIEPIVREEPDRSGAIEMLMPTIQSVDLWRESKRYGAYGPEMLRARCGGEEPDRAHECAPHPGASGTPGRRTERGGLARWLH